MNKDEFEKKFNELKDKYGLFWSWSCDLLSVADIDVYTSDTESDEDFITRIDVDTDEGRVKGIEEIENHFISK